MPVVAPLDRGPARRESWRLSLENAARQTQNYSDPTTGDIELARRVTVSYSPDYPAAGEGDRSFDVCAEDGSNITFPTETADLLTFQPFGISKYKSCPSIGFDVAQTVVAARSMMAAWTSHLTEEVLWTGDLDVGTSIETITGGDNVRLASSTATLIDGSNAHDLTVALGLVNQWVADNVGPFRVWIHGTPQLAPYLGFYGQAVRTQNGQSVEQFVGDHRFVLGSGYDAGSSELTVSDVDGVHEAWLIVTNPVRFVAGAITPGESANPEPFINRSTNRVDVRAARAVLAEWDTSVHAAIKVCLPAPGPACD